MQFPFLCVFSGFARASIDFLGVVFRAKSHPLKIGVFSAFARGSMAFLLGFFRVEITMQKRHFLLLRQPFFISVHYSLKEAFSRGFPGASMNVQKGCFQPLRNRFELFFYVLLFQLFSTFNSRGTVEKMKILQK